MKFLLNYNTGAGNAWYDSPEEAIKNCKPTYTQENITVEDDSGNILYRARWNSVAWDPNAEHNLFDEAPGLYKDFGSFGYYSNFETEQ